MASDIDSCANETYERNFGIEPWGDITKVDASSIPRFDILCAGFPCQSFSNVGPGGGLRDPRGALIYEVFRILKAKKPKAFILENVKGLSAHNGGKTLEYIIGRLKRAGYRVYHKILETKDFDLPQLRKRLFMVGIDKKYNAVFRFPEAAKQTKKLGHVMQGKTERDYAFTIRIGGRRSGLHNRFNWDCYVVDGKARYIRVEECLELQGFPRDFFLAGNEDQRFKQVGNSVPVNVVREVGRALVEIGIFNG